MGAKIVLLYSDESAHTVASPPPSDVPSSDAINTAVQRCIAALDTLTPDTLSAAAMIMRMHANVTQAMAHCRDH